jgi:MYXO-CTERM domain-containing protein
MMKPGLASFGILAAVLIASGALADAGADAAVDAAAGAAGAGTAGSAGGGGTSGSDAGAAGSGGFAGELSCGNKTCTGWSISTITIPPCCAGPQQQKCGAFVGDQLAGFGLPPGCHEIEQVGKVGCECPALPISTPLGGIDLPGCCREASSTCGAMADLSQFGGPDMGCIDPSMVDGGTSTPCSYDTCAGTAGAGGSGGAGATSGAGGSAGSAASSGSAGTATDGGAGTSGGGGEEDDGGCGCRAPAGSGPLSAWLAALALLAAAGLRRRSR